MFFFVTCVKEVLKYFFLVFNDWKINRFFKDDRLEILYLQFVIVSFEHKLKGCIYMYLKRAKSTNAVFK